VHGYCHHRSSSRAVHPGGGPPYGVQRVDAAVFATNYLGHFALTAGLRTALAAAGRARIVSLSSSAHLHSPVVFGDLDSRLRPYDPRQAYAESKTAAVMLAVEATRRWSADGIYANAVNPGAIATGLQKYTGGLKTRPSAARPWSRERQPRYSWLPPRSPRESADATSRTLTKLTHGQKARACSGPASPATLSSPGMPHCSGRCPQR
jgi:NAD(P)-dependent dehydrogenase (short-subunit alcohol dehydrogenase family)